MHEHLDNFGLINMNARLYDPEIGRFISPDPYVQAPTFSQSFNRYSYCLNNPLIYNDPSGEFFYIVPNISWSKEGGWSVGVSFIFGVPGLGSVQFGAGYNGQSGFYGYAGATAGFSTAYVTYSQNGGWNAGITLGISPFMGFPVSTNFTSVGFNYNYTHNYASFNYSAWTYGQNGNWSFNPSVSAMIFPERTTNWVRGHGFKTNEQVFNYMMTMGNETCQEILDYFGFKGTYIEGEGDSNSYINRKSGKSGIRYRDDAFHSYSTLFSVYMKESFHLRRLREGETEYADSDFYPTARRAPEERLGLIHQYKNRGLYLDDEYNYLKVIKGVEDDIIKYNNNMYYNTPYHFTPFQSKWWHFIYRIPRVW
jgi:RHS repeat-associated protein